MNKVLLMGRLTRDPEIRYSKTANPIAVVRYTLAVDRQFKQEGGQDADFINIKALGKRGEFASKYFKKGQMVAVVGSLQVHRDNAQDGQTRYYTEVLANEQHFAESRASFEARSGQPSQNNNLQPSPQAPTTPSTPEGFYPINEDLDDDLPF